MRFRCRCQEFTDLPPVCKFVNVANDCCPKVQCLPPPTTAPLPTTTTIRPTTVAPTGPCVSTDKLPNCNQYDKDTACVGLYEAWARDNCAVYCGYCREFLLVFGLCNRGLDWCKKLMNKQFHKI